MLALDWKSCIVLALLAVSGVGLLASCGPPQPQAAVASPRAVAVKVADHWPPGRVLILCSDPTPMLRGAEKVG